MNWRGRGLHIGEPLFQNGFQPQIMAGDDGMKENCRRHVLGGSLEVSRQWKGKERYWIKHIFHYLRAKLPGLFECLCYIRCACLLATEIFIVSNSTTN